MPRKDDPKQSFFLSTVIFSAIAIPVVGIAASRLGITSGPIAVGIALGVLAIGLVFSWFLGARIVAPLARRMNTKNAILLALVVYAGVSVWGYFLATAVEFWLLAVMVGLVQGGSQALSRSLFGNMVPKAQTAEFYGFYDMSSKFAGLLGPFVFATVAIMAGSSRLSIMALIVFFIVGGLILSRVNEEEGVRVAREADARASLVQGMSSRRSGSMSELPEPNLALDLVRVTEAAALAAGRWMGRGNKIAADQAAVDAMRLVLNTIEMDGVIVIGEGEKDEAPMLFNGERLGTGEAPAVDIAVDPVEGTSLTARGSSGALSVAALAERGSMYAPGSLVYMDKIAVGPEARGVIDINAPVEANLKAIARAKGRDVDDLTVIILDRPRHAALIETVRQTGARIRLIHDGDVSGGVSTALDDTGIDVLLGVGGSPEAVITAAALKCLGGEIQCKLWPRDDRERQYAAEHGLDLQAVLTMDDLVKSDNVFFSATGITRGELLDGVRYFGGGARTSSVVMRSKSGTIRYVTATHRWDKLMRFSQIKFD